MHRIAPRRALLGMLVLAPATALLAAAPVEAAGEGPYASAKTCAACHQTIHQYWSESEHSRAANKPSFLDSLGVATRGAGDPQAVQQGCVWCNAPTAVATGDYALKDAVTREGVSCDFCHTVTGVNLDKAGSPFETSPGPVKQGPLEYAKSSFHATEFSPLHKGSALLCAGCHEHKNALGVSVLSTYSEWRDGPYPARGVTCQECHMPLVPGSTVREGLASTQRVINMHRLFGGSAASQLKRGLELKIDSVTRTAAAAEVQVTVANVAVGHSVPGGLSTKTLVLAVGVESASGELLNRRERTYRRDLDDAQGQALSLVSDLFLKSASVGQDTRIKQKEARTERFTVPVPEGARAIVARLEYRDASDPKAGPTTTRITEERRDLTGR